MKEQRIDLHLHTYYSDGVCSPTEVVRREVDLGMSEIAITDHDNVKGVEEAVKEGEKLGINVRKGIEFTTENHMGIELHILGYDMDIQDPKLLAMCDYIKALRDDRNKKLMKELKKEYNITWDQVLELAPTDYVNRSVIARALIEKGYGETIPEVFSKIFSKEPYKSIKMQKIKTKEAIDLIHKAGGVAVLAHPGRTKKIGKRESEEFFVNISLVFDELKKLGIDGIEAIYSTHSEFEKSVFEEMAKERKLIVTRGSDYHGTN